ncbi:MAG: DinB family protein [Bacteroidota bacterium]
MASFSFNALRQTRNNILRLVSGFTTEQLNTQPEGFNNNLAWHLGHVVVTQQLLCYRNAGLDTQISEDWINRFRKGTHTEGVISEEELSAIKKEMEALVEVTEKDYAEGKFTSYDRYETSYGLILNTPEEAFAFNDVHEALHLGYMMAQRRLLT